jgi:hypothetical protein
MWWYLLQGLIFFAVCGSNIRWHWSDNYIVVNSLALFCAFAATALLGDLFRFLRWLGALIRKARRVREGGDGEMMTAVDEHEALAAVEDALRKRGSQITIYHRGERSG